jgi:hypothetical protein
VALATEGLNDSVHDTIEESTMLYLMLIYQDEAKMKAASAEEQSAIGKGYGELNAFLAQSGNLRGTATWPAGITTVRSREGKMITTDGPYAETREGVGGFFLVDVKDLDAAIKVAERVPGARYGAVEIRPVKADR